MILINTKMTLKDLEKNNYLAHLEIEDTILCKNGEDFALHTVDEEGLKEVGIIEGEEFARQVAFAYSHYEHKIFREESCIVN